MRTRRRPSRAVEKLLAEVRQKAHADRPQGRERSIYLQHDDLHGWAVLVTDSGGGFNLSDGGTYDDALAAIFSFIVENYYAQGFRPELYVCVGADDGKAGVWLSDGAGEIGA